MDAKVQLTVAGIFHVTINSTPSSSGDFGSVSSSRRVANSIDWRVLEMILPNMYACSCCHPCFQPAWASPRLAGLFSSRCPRQLNFEPNGAIRHLRGVFVSIDLLSPKSGPFVAVRGWRPLCGLFRGSIHGIARDK